MTNRRSPSSYAIIWSAPGFGVLVAYDGKKALSLAKTEKPDMVVLDLGLPQLDGLDFTREFRKSSNVPIIMLTAARRGIG